jgi:hypothetical protein
MGRAIETVTGYASPATTSAGAFVPLTPQTGQSFAVRAFPSGASADLVAPFASFGVEGFFQVKSPRMHDQVVATTFGAGPNTNGFSINDLAGANWSEPAYSTDVLTVQVATVVAQTAATHFLGGFSVAYSDLAGIQQSLATWAQVQSYAGARGEAGKHYVSWVTPSSSATNGALGAGVAINSVNDQFKANGSYALLGYLCPVGLGAVLLQGTDTGNLFVGGPGSPDPKVTRNYFVDLSLALNLPAIPIVQANNRANTFVSVADPATASTQFVVGLVWQYLGNITPPAT